MPPPSAGHRPGTDPGTDSGTDLGTDPAVRLQRLLGGPGRRRNAPTATAWADVLRGRWSLPLTAGLAVLVLAAVVAALLALRAVTGAPSPSGAPGPPEPAAASTPQGVVTPPAAPVGPSPAPPAPPPSPAVDVVVDVEGHVSTPGLVHLPAGSRVDDAVRAAGGAGESADLTRLNLARPLVDGEQVLVPAPGDPAPPAPAGTGAGAGARAGAGGAGAAGTPGAAAPVALGTATLADLDALPGVGPVLAQRIVDWRTQHGGFSSTDELGEVSGIGDKLLERLRPLVTV